MQTQPTEKKKTVTMAPGSYPPSGTSKTLLPSRPKSAPSGRDRSHSDESSDRSEQKVEPVLNVITQKHIKRETLWVAAIMGLSSSKAPAKTETEEETKEEAKQTSTPPTFLFYKGKPGMYSGHKGLFESMTIMMQLAATLGFNGEFCHFNDNDLSEIKRLKRTRGKKPGEDTCIYENGFDLAKATGYFPICPRRGATESNNKLILKDILAFKAQGVQNITVVLARLEDDGIIPEEQRVKDEEAAHALWREHNQKAIKQLKLNVITYHDLEKTPAFKEAQRVLEPLFESNPNLQRSLAEDAAEFLATKKGPAPKTEKPLSRSTTAQLITRLGPPQEEDRSEETLAKTIRAIAEVILHAKTEDLTDSKIDKLSEFAASTAKKLGRR